MASFEFKKFLNLLAFIGIIMIAVALVVAKIAEGDLSSALKTVAEAIAYFITAIGAFYYARSRKNIGYIIAYIVAVILVVIFMFLG